MYTESAKNTVKDAADIVEVVGSYVKLKNDGINKSGCCPFHNERTPSFKVSPAKQRFKCFGCGKSGDVIDFIALHNKISFPAAMEELAKKYNVSLEVADGKPKSYAKPVWKNNTELSEAIVKWFEGRGISQRTLKEMKITEGKEWMPQAGKEVTTMQFNYFRNGQLVNTKYRGPNKSFKLHKDAELILYNLDAIKDADEVYLVEGEIDALSFVEAGFKNVLSVPNGANKETNNLQYLDNCIEEFKNIKKIHLALDNDANGRKLREDIAERFGKDICDYIEFKECKDANECLMTHGIQGLIECIGNKIEFPLEGAFTISTYSNDIDDMYVNGLEKGIDVGLEGFDCRLVKGYIYTWTGIPSHGKSQTVDEVSLRSVVFHGWKGAYYSPENKPTQLHFSKMARVITGKHWEGDNKMTEQEKNEVKAFLDKKIWFIKPVKGFGLQDILTDIRNLQKRHGLDFFVIDAWNKLEHKEDSTSYIGRSLDLLADFCEKNKLLVHLVAHPTKVDKDNKGKYNVPTLYNINGSSNFYNKTDAGFSVYRDFDTNETYIYRQKIKFDHWGIEGFSKYKFDIPSKRYYVEGCFDGRNWITQGQAPQTNAIQGEDAIQTTDNEFDF